MKTSREVWKLKITKRYNEALKNMKTCENLIIETRREQILYFIYKKN